MAISLLLSRASRAVRLLATAALFLAVNSRVLTAQVGCESPPFTSCNDPTPAVNIDGNANNGYWTHYDATFAVISQWTVTSGFAAPGAGATISGDVRVPSPALGCPDVHYTATGTISPSDQVDGARGSTAFSWTATNPSPSGTCGGFTPVASMNYSGTITNKSNDLGAGTWTRSDGISGALTLRRSFVEPNGETTIADGFGTVPGFTTSMARFRQVLTDTTVGDPPDFNGNMFQGRQVFETSGGPGADDCYDASGMMYPGGKFSIKGSVWNVGYVSTFSGDTWGWDTIGWPPAGVDWYRTNLAALPCAATAPQKMNIVVNGDSGGNIVYKQLDLHATIGGTFLQVTRDGVTQTSNQ